MKKSMINTEKISGYVYSHKLEKRESGPNSKNPGTVFISGTLDVAVDEEGLNVVTVHFTYVTKVFGKSGKVNNTFKVLEEIINSTGKTWLEGGKENAYKVEIDTNLGVNDFYNREGELVSSKRNEGGFVTIVKTMPPQNERNSFKMDMVVTKIRTVEADEERHIDKDYVVVTGAVFDFKKSLLPVDFIVKNPNGINYFESLDFSEGPLFTTVWGVINILKTQVKKEEESAWGEASVNSYGRTNKEWIITGMSKVPYDFGDEEYLTDEEFRAAIQDRNVYLADVKARQEAYEASKNSPAPASTSKIPSGEYNF